MDSKYFGDSYDLAKRFFIEVLKSKHYTVCVDPKFYSNDDEEKSNYCRLIGAKLIHSNKTKLKNAVLFIDPDTGIGKTKTNKHVPMQYIVNMLKSNECFLVMVYDQSYRRSKSPSRRKQMDKKLYCFYRGGVFGFFYKSHTNFFFGALNKNRKYIEEYRRKLLQMGIPKSQLIRLPRK